MRAFQLPRLVQPFLSDVNLSSKTMPENKFLQLFWARFVKPGTVFFVTKHLIGRLHPETVDMLHRRHCKVCLDIVDLRSRKWPASELGADCLIASSLTGVDSLNDHIAKHYSTSAAKPMVVSILHNADIRLYGNQIVPLDSASFAYFGNRKNAMLSDAILEFVTVLDGSGGGNLGQSLQQLRNFNVHYAVRPEDGSTDRTKPFTKGANAAVMGALIIVNRSAPDALAFLGEDYPFFTESTDEREILEVLNKAKDAFGSADWTLAQERCRELAYQVSPENLARQLRQMMDRLM